MGGCRTLSPVGHCERRDRGPGGWLTFVFGRPLQICSVGISLTGTHEAGAKRALPDFRLHAEAIQEGLLTLPH